MRLGLSSLPNLQLTRANNRFSTLKRKTPIWYYPWNITVVFFGNVCSPNQSVDPRSLTITFDEQLCGALFMCAILVRYTGVLSTEPVSAALGPRIDMS